MLGRKVIGVLASAAAVVAVVAGVWIVSDRGGVGPSPASPSSPQETPSGLLSTPPPPSSPPPEDPTTIDHVAKPGLERLFSEEQTRRIGEIRRRFAELEPLRIEAEREMTLARAQSMGSPDIAPKVAAFKAAREELDQFIRAVPERIEAEQRAAAMRRREEETRARAEKFSEHVNAHWRERRTDADGCEWCRRDAARLLAADPTLAADYAREQRDIGMAAMQSATAARDAVVAVRAATQAARTSEAGRALAERLAAAQRDLDEAVGALPEVARWRENGEAVRAEQKALVEELRELHRQAPLVEASVARGPSGGDGAVQ